MKNRFSSVCLSVCLSVRSFALYACALTILTSAADAVAATSVNCDIIIPYQWGKMLNNQERCYKQSPGMRAICISACKSACTQTAQECGWDLSDKLACWQGCEDGPLISTKGDVLKDLGAGIDVLSAE